MEKHVTNYTGKDVADALFGHVTNLGPEPAVVPNPCMKTICIFVTTASEIKLTFPSFSRDITFHTNKFVIKFYCTVKRFPQINNKLQVSSQMTRFLFAELY